jgi:hypothetical protein
MIIPSFIYFDPSKIFGFAVPHAAWSAVRDMFYAFAHARGVYL